MDFIFLGLGANLGDAQKNLNLAIEYLKQENDIQVQAQSSFYQSAPVDAIGNDFINCVIQISSQLQPLDLLKKCHAIESRLGRIRSFRNAPRAIDIDILLFGNEIVCYPNLTIPHPRLTTRSFALLPLIEICEDIHIPTQGLARNYLLETAHQVIKKI